MSRYSSAPSLDLVAQNGDSAAISRRNFVKVSLATGSLFLASGALAACSSAPSSANNKQSILRMGTPNRLASFDPYQEHLLNSPAFHTFYSYLIHYDDNLKPIPQMAESWTFAPDHRSVTIKIRDTAFHSGKPVLADDIVAGVERQRNPDTGFDQAGAGATIASASKVDDHTVTVTFKQPTPESAITDWMYDFAVIEASQNNADILQKSPAGGCGPFKFKSYEPGVKLEMVRNPNYWDSGKPSIAGAELQFFQDQNALRSALQTGAIDVALYISPSSISSLQSQFTIIQGSLLAKIEVVELNTKYPPYDDVLVRKAFQRALDRERIVKEAWFGLGGPIYGIFPEASPAFDKAYTESLSFDLNAAKALLDQSQSEKSSVMTYPSNDPVRGQALQILQADLKKIGFDMKIKPEEVATHGKEGDAGTLPATMSPIDPALGNPASLTNRELQLSSNPLWKGGVPDKQWTDAVNHAQVALTPNAQQAAYAEMNKAQADLAWIIGCNLGMYMFAANKSVKGFAINEKDQILLTDVSL